MSAVAVLDFAAVLVFALTGALAASRAQLDIVGFAFVACLTAVGGGTVRDLLLDRNPVFWVAEPTYIAIACAAAVVVFFTAHRMESRYRWLTWFDAFALAVAVPAGVSLALDMGQSAPVVIIMGMVTGCLGGLMRDVVCNEVPLVLKQGELYASAAFAGACGAVAVSAAGMGAAAALVVCAGLTLALRAGSVGLGWRLPVYKARAPRE
ncbi:trimeric intracellular cation channel family protein [Marimonas lutisalis]|uniref:trimeric intracellular cation channel family protein n=1 Tax=Marimonas lutisalis TaxID=2545756 RepID=UPI0010F99ED0|nr:trimeric intracellular cation channel family protein [Marimonas lutisalis]